VIYVISFREQVLSCAFVEAIMFFARRESKRRSIYNVKEGVEEKINLQREGSNAKPYQVRQVRYIILKYQLGGKQ